MCDKTRYIRPTLYTIYSRTRIPRLMLKYRAHVLRHFPALFFFEFHILCFSVVYQSFSYIYVWWEASWNKNSCGLGDCLFSLKKKCANIHISQFSRYFSVYYAGQACDSIVDIRIHNVNISQDIAAYQIIFFYIPT